MLYFRNIKSRWSGGGSHVNSSSLVNGTDEEQSLLNSEVDYPFESPAHTTLSGHTRNLHPKDYPECNTIDESNKLSKIVAQGGPEKLETVC